MNDRLEQYLGAVERGLPELPEKRRQDEITEVRQHLDALIAARQYADIDAEAATDAALRQFGSARRVSLGIRSAYWRERIGVSDTVVGAALLTVGGSILVNGLLSPLTISLRSLIGIDPMTIPHATPLLWATYLLPIVLPYLFVGVLVGVLTPQRGVKGAFVGIGGYTLYSQLTFVLLYRLLHIHHEVREDYLLLQFSVIGFTVAASVLGAALGKQYSQKVIV